MTENKRLNDANKIETIQIYNIYQEFLHYLLCI